jgi:hypothetical protein
MSENKGTEAAGRESEEAPPEELTRAQKAELARAAFNAMPTATKVQAVVVTCLSLVGAVFVAKGGYKVARAGVRRVRR